MRHGPYFIDGFGYREANDEDELADLNTLLREQGLRSGGGRVPPYYTEDLKNGVAALQRRERFEPADGDVRRGSGLHTVLNELAAGVPRGAFILNDDGTPLASPVGDGLASDPGDVAKLNKRLAALGFSPRFPDGREAYFLKPSIAKGIGDFQDARGFRRTEAVRPDDDTDRALRQAIAELKHANAAAFRAAEARLADNKEAAEARRWARNGAFPGDAPPRARLASFGADDFSGHSIEADREAPERKSAPDPDAAQLDDPPEASVGPESSAPARDQGGTVLAQSTETPFAEAERRQLEERIDARLKAKLEAAAKSGTPMTDLRRAEIAREAMEEEGGLSRWSASLLWLAHGSRDPAARVRALAAIAEAFRRYPGAASRHLEKARPLLPLASEVGRLHDDPHAPDDLKNDPAALERQASLDARTPNINHLLDEYGAKAGGAAGAAAAMAQRRRPRDRRHDPDYQDLIRAAKRGELKSGPGYQSGRKFYSPAEFGTLAKNSTPGSAVMIDPQRLRTAQATFSENMSSKRPSSGGPPAKTVDDLAAIMREGKQTIEPVRVVEKDGMLYAADTRRVIAARRAGTLLRVHKVEANSLSSKERERLNQAHDTNMGSYSISEQRRILE
jgi:hypothetical protein